MNSEILNTPLLSPADGGALAGQMGVGSETDVL